MTIKLAVEAERVCGGRGGRRGRSPFSKGEMKKDEDVRRDPPFMHHGTAARDNDFFVNYQVAYEAVPGVGGDERGAETLGGGRRANFCHTPRNS